MAKKPPKKRRSGMSAKQRKLVKAMTSGMTLTDAAKKAKYSSPASAHEAYKTIRLRFHPLLEEAGFNLKEIVKDNFGRLLKMREAVKTEHFPHQGIVMDTKYVEDNPIRLRAINDVNRYTGAVNSDPDDPERNTAYAGPAQVSITLVLPDAASAKAVMELRPDGPANHQQLRVDAVLDQNPRRSRSEPSL